MVLAQGVAGESTMVPLLHTSNSRVMATVAGLVLASGCIVDLQSLSPGSSRPGGPGVLPSVSTSSPPQGSPTANPASPPAPPPVPTPTASGTPGGKASPSAPAPAVLKL